MRTDVAFPGCGGTSLHGWLYRPTSTGRSPGLIMAHGFSATKEMALDIFAEAFCTAGFSVLVYDHRNLGTSGGEPRQEINIWAQARDYRYAFDYLASQPDVDPARIGIWGSSFSGGEVIVVGACDRRVKAVIANVPFASLPEGVGAPEANLFKAIRANLLDESGNGLADAPGDAMGPFAVVEEEGNPLPVFLPFPEATTWFLKSGKHSEAHWQNQVTLRNCFGTTPRFDPGACITHIAPTPLLMVVATDDRLAETNGALRAFEAAGEPKQLVMLEGDHFVPYHGEGFQQASRAMIDFLKRHL